VLAEGVEDIETLDVLRELGCDRAQGYLMSRPVPPERLRDAVNTWHANAGLVETHR
jgi:EAL domain-containing protein (putative c-di-GMP-specific phosphodiesterase class I)